MQRQPLGTLQKFRETTLLSLGSEDARIKRCLKLGYISKVPKPGRFPYILHIQCKRKNEASNDSK